MKLKGIIFCFLLTGIACSTHPSSVSELSVPESEYSASPSPTTASRLSQSIVEYLQNNPTLDQSSKSNLLARALEVCQEQKMWQQAANFLNSMIRNTSDSDEIDDKAQELIGILENMNNPAASASLKLAYKKAYPKSNANITFKVNSSVEDGSIDSRIERLGNAMFNDSTHQFNERTATQFVDACEAHALLMPNEDSSIEYLHKAGETARSIRSFRKAISIYDWLYEKYPSDSRSSQALFLKAFTFDNDLRDLTTAKSLYEEYLEKYPNDDFFDDTQFLLKNLGKSDEEILKELSESQ